MNPISIPLLATLFTTASALVGIPSITLLLFYLAHQVVKLTGSAAANPNFGTNPDAVLLVLKWMTGAIGALSSLVSSAAQLLFNVLAVVAAAGVVFAIACWFTGRGLGAQAHWARISAGALLTLLLLPSLLLALSLHNIGRLVMLALVGFFVVALHTVWAGYAAQSS